MQYSLISMVQTDNLMFVVNMVRQKREIYILTWAEWSLKFFWQVESELSSRNRDPVELGSYVCSCRKQGHISDM